MNDDRVIIFDTTLRDGEQSPGISLNTQREARDRAAARAAGRGRDRGRLPDRLAGRLRGRPGDRPPGRGPVIAGLARVHVGDIDAAYGAVRDAERPRIHTFVSTSDIHIEHQLRLDARGRQGPGARRRRPRAARWSTTSSSRPMDATARGRRVHRRGRPDRARRGRDDDQHPRHRRLHDAGRVRRVPRPAVRARAGPARRRPVASTATTTSASPSPTRSPACRRARARSSARSTGSASAPATPRSRRS